MLGPFLEFLVEVGKRNAARPIDAATVGQELAGQELEEGALPRAIMADEDGVFTFVQLEGDAVVEFFVRIGKGYVLNGYDCHGADYRTSLPLGIGGGKRKPRASRGHLRIGAGNQNRTGMGCPIRPSNVRVYHFRHSRSGNAYYSQPPASLQDGNRFRGFALE